MESAPTMAPGHRATTGPPPGHHRATIGPPRHRVARNITLEVPASSLEGRLLYAQNFFTGTT